MTSRLIRRLPILAFLVALAVPDAGAAPCALGELGVQGRVLDVTGSPVPCTLVTIVTVGPLGVHTYQVRTRGDGTFSTCFQCMGSPYFSIVAEAEECGASAQATNVPCIDGAGQPNVVDFGDLACADPVQPSNTHMSGSVACRSGALLEPVAECSIALTSPGGESAFTRTDAAGQWSACFPCFTGSVMVEAQCCGQVQTVAESCGSMTVPTFVCDDCPVAPCVPATEVRVSGLVTCPDAGGVPVPVVGCPVTVETVAVDANADTIIDQCAPLVSQTVTTDADGRYAACIPCPLDAAGCEYAQWGVAASAGCCDAVQVSMVTGCPPDVEMAELACAPPCPNSPPCTPSEGQLHGQVTCISPLGDVQPMANCEVRITPQGCAVAPFSRFTNLNGVYEACLPCPDCTGVAVTALCCGVGAATALDCGGTQLDVSCGNCGTGNPCAPEQEIHGQVRCAEFVGGPVHGVPNTGVTIQCQGGAGPVQTVTDGDGNYSACYPCGTCPVLEVVAACGGSNLINNTTCDERQVDVSCGLCDPPRPCPGPPSIEVTGRISCEQGGSPTPLASCPVVITPHDLLGNPFPPVNAVSDGNGEYVACLPCPPMGMRFIEARGTCCDAVSSTSVIGCPETAALNTVECSDCSPCPTGMTKVQGRIRCRGGGIVANCGIVITMETCSDALTLTTVTDAQGKFELCVPCPCPGSILRATAQCCDATRAIQVDDCGPVTPLPTLFCTSPCP